MSRPRALLLWPFSLWSMIVKPRQLSPQADAQTACVWGEGHHDNGANVRYITESVLRAMKQNLQNTPGLKWQYYGSEEGVVTFYPANQLCDYTYDPRFRLVLFSVALHFKNCTSLCFSLTCLVCVHLSESLWPTVIDMYSQIFPF